MRLVLPVGSNFSKTSFFYGTPLPKDPHVVREHLRVAKGLGKEIVQADIEDLRQVVEVSVGDPYDLCLDLGDLGPTDFFHPEDLQLCCQHVLRPPETIAMPTYFWPDDIACFHGALANDTPRLLRLFESAPEP